MKVHVVPAPHPIFKVPATRTCYKPWEAAHKGLQEGIPTLQRATGTLILYPHYCLLFQTMREDIIQRCTHLPPESIAQSQRPAGPVPETDETVTRALPCLWFKRLLSLSFLLFLKSIFSSLIISKDFRISCY